MKRVLQLLAISMLTLCFTAQAQERAVTGTILSIDDGEGLPGVNVIVKGTSIGTTSDLDGNFKLSVPSRESTLVFSSIGFVNQEMVVGDQTTFRINMASDVTQLGEVVVTALGIERDKKSLGFSSQQVEAEDLRVARESNVNAALAGKVSGVQIVSGSGAKFGTPAIRIRGVRGLAPSSPLYILDGMFISDPASINMDNVASISVLKGANAAALYGNKARDGVVMITSKTAKQGELTVTFNNTTQVERVSTLIDYQNEYGGGYTQEWSQFTYDPTRDDPSLAGLNGADIPEFYADESWGPKLDGHQVAQWNAFVPGAEGYGTTRPWAPQPDNIRDYFETGVYVNNSLSVGKAESNYSVNVTLTNSQRSGVLPGSNQDKTFLNLNSTVDLSDKLKLTGRANYANTQTEGNLFEGYNSIGSNVNQWFQRQLDMGLLKRNYRLADGRYTSWNMNSARDTSPLYWDNPYTYALANTASRSKETFQGKFGLDYEVIDGLVLSISGARNTDQWTEDFITASGTLDLDAYATNAYSLDLDVYEFTAKYNTQLNDNFSLSALAGSQINNYDFQGRFNSTVGGLSVPELYTIAASVDRPNSNTFYAQKSIRSIFAQASVGYKEIIFVDATIRTDWDSGLPKGKNDFTYPSVSTSFIFSELLGSQNFLSFGKLRASYAEVGQEIVDANGNANPYVAQLTYGLGKPYGSNATMGVPNALIAPDLTAATTSAIEVGMELAFMQGRIRTDFSYYNYDNTDELINVSTPATSGFTSLLLNAGKGYTRGWDAMIGGSPVKAGDFNWDVNFNFARSKNFIEELYPGLNAITLANGFRGTSTSGGWGSPQAKAEVDREWGTIYGRKIQRNADGTPIVGSNGQLLFDINEELGKVLPDYTGGIFNRFTYKNIDLSFTIDWQIGGQFHSISKMFTAYSGLSSETVGLNDKGNPMRDDPADGGGLKFDAVFEDGTPNDVYLAADSYWKSLFALHEWWMYDATFVKMREIRLGYTIPESVLSNIFIKNAAVAFVANNPWLIHSKVDGIDPSEIGGDTVDARNNGSWVESGNLPPTRSFGLDIRLGF